MNDREAFAALQNNLADMIQESQIKLGYTRTPMNLYYPLATLNRMFDTALSVEEMEALLRGFGAFSRDVLGEVAVSQEEGRFCLRVPEEGMAHVYEQGEGSGFLREFIACIRSGAESIEPILEVFSRYSDCVCCEQMDGEEMDYLIYFADGKPDAYRYCIQFEMGMATYHRFTKKDYEALAL